MERDRKKRSKAWLIILCLVGTLAITGLIFTHFGGFGTGESASPEALGAYGGTVKDIVIPEEAAIVALGEATHGNREFQQLKLDVFRHLVEHYGVRAFALEGDYGGCEQVDRYIHGGEGTPQEAAAAIGFAIYRTEEMAALISYMRAYNQRAEPGDDLRFYGFDMQRCGYNIRFLAEACRQAGVDPAPLEGLAEGENWSNALDTAERIAVITQVKADLISKNGSEKALHLADILLQNCALQEGGGGNSGDYSMRRDRFMAENTLWIARQEREAGRQRIFVAAHNGHVAKWASYDQMGKLLADELGEGYYVIGTDFYKTRCNMPSGRSGRRTNQVFYSHDPLAKAAKLAGLDVCWLDFGKASQSPELAAFLSDHHYMGSLGEGYSLLMRLLPPSYRIFQPPAGLYDGMIFVANATPTRIIGGE